MKLGDNKHDSEDFSTKYIEGEYGFNFSDAEYNITWTESTKLPPSTSIVSNKIFSLDFTCSKASSIIAIAQDEP